MSDVTYDLKLDDISNKLNSDEFGLFTAQTVYKHYFLSMPFNTGNFSQQITFKPFAYTHEMLYSSYVYFNNMNFRKDKHPYAMSNYIQGFNSVASPKIEKDVSNYIKTKVTR